VMGEAITRNAIAAQNANWAGSALRRRLQRHHRDADAMFRAWAAVWLSEDLREWSIADLLPRITVPLLAIQGHDDSHGTMRQVDEIAQRAAGPITVEKLAQCGHDPFRDQPQQMLALCARFVAGLAPMPIG